MATLCNFRANVILKNYSVIKHGQYRQYTAVSGLCHESFKKPLTSNQHICLSKGSLNKHLFSTPIITSFLSKHYCDFSSTQPKTGYGNEFILRMRGLPYEATTEDILNFFKPLNIMPDDVTIIFKEGRPSGRAVVKFNSYDEVLEALKFDRKYMGHRYVELNYGSSLSNQSSGFGQQLNQKESHATAGPFSEKNTDYKVILRGLPYKATEADIVKFFEPINITPTDIQMKYHIGRPSGMCDVFFASHEDVRAALMRNRAYIGSRYIDVLLPSTLRDRNTKEEEVN